MLVKCQWCAAVREPWPPWPRQVGAGKELAEGPLPRTGDVGRGWGSRLVGLWRRWNRLSLTSLAFFSKKKKRIVAIKSFPIICELLNCLACSPAS